MNGVRIFEMSNGGYSGPRWLCSDHAKARAAKWTLKPGATVPHDLLCDDCLREAPQTNAPVDFVTPHPDSRLPSPAEVARMPGVAPGKPWAAPKQPPKKTTERKAA